MIDFSKLAFTEEKNEELGGKNVNATVTLRVKFHVEEGENPKREQIEQHAKAVILRGVYGDLVPHVIKLVQFAQSRCAMPSDAATVLKLSNSINAILLDDPAFTNAEPVEPSRIIRLRR